MFGVQVIALRSIKKEGFLSRALQLVYARHEGLKGT